MIRCARDLSGEVLVKGSMGVSRSKQRESLDHEAGLIPVNREKEGGWIGITSTTAQF